MARGDGHPEPSTLQSAVPFRAWHVGVVNEEAGVKHIETELYNYLKPGQKHFLKNDQL